MNNRLAIVNPCSGQFRSSGFEKDWMPKLERVVDKIVYTDGNGHAGQIASENKACEVVAVVGGDGTIFEVIPALDRGRQQLAVLPTGRGNCLARDLGIRRVADGLQALTSGVNRTIDLIRADIDLSNGDRLTCLAASTIALGYVVDVVERADRMPGARSYGYALASVVTRPRPFECRIAADGVDRGAQRCTGIVINNTLHLANFLAFVDADLEDGLLDSQTSYVGWPRQTFHNLSILSRSNLYNPTDYRQSTSISISLNTPRTLMIDGQLYPNVVALTAECLPAALSCRHNGPA